MTNSILLTIEPAKQVLTPNTDGTGYHVRREGEHRANLRVGNVSLAFDGRNQFIGNAGANFDRERIELTEYVDDPVRLDNIGCPKCTDTAEALLFALAADLGYTVSRGG